MFIPLTIICIVLGLFLIAPDLGCLILLVCLLVSGCNAIF